MSLRNVLTLEFETGMVPDDEFVCRKVLFPRRMDMAINYRHMLAAVFLLQRGKPCFRRMLSDGSSLILSRNRQWQLSYEYKARSWVLRHRNLGTIAFEDIRDVLIYLREVEQ